MSEAAKTPYKPPVSELGPGQTSYTSITEKMSGIVTYPQYPGGLVYLLRHWLSTPAWIHGWSSLPAL